MWATNGERSEPMISGLLKGFERPATKSFDVKGIKTCRDAFIQIWMNTGGTGGPCR